MNEFGLSDKSHHILMSIIDKYNEIKEVRIYGSRAKGNFTNRSDVDLVICNSTITRKQIARIINEINESDFPYLVDLQAFEDIKNEDLLFHIKRVGKILYTKNQSS
jgi:predicted nucleotidyltransferase